MAPLGGALVQPAQMEEMGLQQGTWDFSKSSALLGFDSSEEVSPPFSLTPPSGVILGGWTGSILNGQTGLPPPPPSR